MNTIKLQFPFKRLDGTECNEIKIRRAKVSDLRFINSLSDANDTEKVFRLTCNLCDMAPQELDLIDASDFAAISEQIKGFLSPAAN